MEDAQQRKLESAKKRALQETGDLMERLAAVIPQLDAGATTKDLVEQAYGEATPESVERASQALADANERLQEEIDRLQAENLDEIDQALAAELEAEGLEMYQDPEPEEQENQEQGEPEQEEPEEKLQQSGVRRELSHPSVEHTTKTFPDISDIFSTAAFGGAEVATVTQTDGPEPAEEQPAGELIEEESVPEKGDHIDQMLSDWEAMKDPTTPLPEISMDLFEEPIEPPERTKAPFNGIKKLDAEMAKRFSYFAKVDGRNPRSVMR